jgi:aspartyl/asparaginyl-tRNA synthetase
MKKDRLQRHLVSEILKMDKGVLVLVRGKIIRVLKNPNKGQKGVAIVELKDNTGIIKIRINSIKDALASKEFFTINRVLNVVGILSIDLKGKKYICGEWSGIYSHGSIDKEYQKADVELKEQQSRSMISKICRVVSEKLEEKGYIEISTKVVSREWNEEAFNIMKVIYPGFGTPVCLVPSPFSQLSDFLLATFNDKAFSVTSSFASGFRFPHSPTEMKIVYAVSMAKDDQPLHELMNEMHDVINGEIKKLLSPENYNLPELFFKTENYNSQVIGDNWTSVIKSVIRYQTSDGDVFMEGSEEMTDGEMWIQTLVVYPTQYMGNLNMRQLLNYERFYDENRHPYGN